MLSPQGRCHHTPHLTTVRFCQHHKGGAGQKFFPNRSAGRLTAETADSRNVQQKVRQNGRIVSVAVIIARQKIVSSAITVPQGCG
jgi:hypothetical protein